MKLLECINRIEELGRQGDTGAAESARLAREELKRIEETLSALTSCHRTFRNVPQEQQGWTSLDEDALQAGFGMIELLRGKPPARGARP